MTEVTAVVRLKSASGLAKDTVVNTFHFSGSDSATTIATNWSTNLTSFYSTIHTPGVTALSGFISGDVSRVALAHEILWYDLADPQPRAPIYTATLSLGALSGSGVNLPKEVAACLSYAGVYGSGIPAARQRGRIYIGPLNSNTIVGASTANPQLDTAFISTLKGAGAFLVASRTAGSAWVVRSKVGGFSTYVTRGWVDNAFDTQRRRGVAATTRNTW